MKIKHYLPLLLALVGSFAAEAKVVLPPIFSDNAIIQRNSNVLFWGKATPTRTVLVIPSWTNDSYHAVADADGNWQCEIPTPDAGQAGVVDEKGSVSRNGYIIRFDDGQVTEIKNVLLGEVWLTSGQSNMEMPMAGFGGQPVEGAAEEIFTAKRSTPIRQFKVKNLTSASVGNEAQGSWKVSSAEAVAEFSAASYYFAKYINEMLGVPVGIINCSWGGVPIEAYMSPEMLSKVGSYDLSHLKDLSKVEQPHKKACTLYNAMLEPILGYKIKGMLWYQGESNKHNAEQYTSLFKTFAETIRSESSSGNFPIYYAEIAPFGYSKATATGAVKLREAMGKLMDEVDNCGLVSTIDLGEQKQVHFRSKREVGERFALWALGKNYGFKGIEYCPPRYEAIKIIEAKGSNPQSIAIKFSNAGKGICFEKNSTPTSFEVAGQDKKFYPANVKRISGEYQLEVSSPEVAAPVAVRYAFGADIIGELFSGYGLAVPMFRSDDWALE